MDVFMWAPWGGASRLLGSANGMMFLLHLDDSAVANGLQWPESAKSRLARATSAPRFAHGAACSADFPCSCALGAGACRPQLHGSQAFRRAFGGPSLWEAIIDPLVILV